MPRETFHEAQELARPLTADQRALLQRFGLTGNAQKNGPTIAEHFAAERPGSNAYRAVQLARAIGSGAFGTDRRGKPRGVAWKKTLGDASKNEYDRRVRAAKARGEYRQVQALRDAYAARRRNRRAEAVAARAAAKAKRAAADDARRRRLAQIRRNTQTGVKAHFVNANLENADKAKKVANVALTRLVGCVQDILALSGVSLSQLLYGMSGMGPKAKAAVKVVGTAVLGAVQGLTPLAGWLLRFAASFQWIAVDAAVTERFIRGCRKSLQNILLGRPTDMRPVVSAAIMALPSRDVRKLAAGVVTSVLETYVYNPYKSTSTEPGMMCKLCGAVACMSRQGTKINANAPRKLADILKRAMQAIDQLLLLDGRKLTVTKALRQAMDTYLGGVSQFVLSLTTTPLGTAITQMVALPLHPVVNKLLKTYGLGITFQDFAVIVLRDFQTVKAFIRKDFSRSMEPVLVSIVTKARPIGLLQGVAGALAKSGATSEFCALCQSAYGTCVRR